MTVLASSILTRVRTQLIDTGTPPRWADSELLNWLGDGERTIVAALPWAYHKRVPVSLVAGTYQSIPSDGNLLLDIVRNLTAGGVAGPPVVQVDRDVLDRQYGDWHTMTPTVNALHYVYDYTDPDNYYVFPPNTGSGSVEIHYSASPPDFVSTSDAIHVRDIFATPLVDYVLYRAHQKDSDFAAGQALAAQYMQAFSAFLQLKAQPPAQESTPIGKTQS